MHSAHLNLQSSEHFSFFHGRGPKGWKGACRMDDRTRVLMIIFFTTCSVTRGSRTKQNSTKSRFGIEPGAKTIGNQHHTTDTTKSVLDHAASLLRVQPADSSSWWQRGRAVLCDHSESLSKQDLQCLQAGLATITLPVHDHSQPNQSTYTELHRLRPLVHILVPSHVRRSKETGACWSLCRFACFLQEHPLLNSYRHQEDPLKDTRAQHADLEPTPSPFRTVSIRQSSCIPGAPTDP